MTDWVELRLILEVCEKYTVCEGGGRLSETCWHKMSAWKQLRAVLEEISSVARARQREFGRRG